MTVNTEPSQDRADAVPASGTRTYIRLWLSQWFACAATSFTVFVLGLNIYVDFDPLWLIVIAYAILFVPFPILSPIAGALVDRWGHRRALLVSNVGTLANLLILVLVMFSNTGGALYATTAVGISTIFRTLQLAAIESVVPLLVPKRHYGRANGPRMLMTGTFVLAGPLFAWLLLSVVAPVVLVIVHCVLVALAIFVVLTTRIPVVRRPDGDASRQSIRLEIIQAWSYLRSRHGLLTLVGFMTVVSATLGTLELAAAGAVFGFAPHLGGVVVSTTCWLGMVVASIAMVVWGVPRRLVPGMLGAGLAFAVALGVAAFRPNLVLTSVGGFIAMGSLAVIIAVIQTALHLKVEPHLLGRVIGLKNTAVTLSHIVGDVGAIVVGVAFFSSNFRAYGMPPGEGWQDVNSPVLAAFIGHGPGRAWALVILLVGVAVAVMVALLAFRSPGLRRLQDDLPDVTPEDRLPQPAPRASVPVGLTEAAPA
jgi:DHA3 family macrolide efflux protein-like MFS transporter